MSSANLDQLQQIHNRQQYEDMKSLNKVLIIGLGQLGLPVAKYVNEKGFDTYGYDISHQAIEHAGKTAVITLL